MPLKPAHFNLASYAREKTPDAFDTIVQIMRQPKTPSAVRLTAAGMIIDRGYGKAAQVLAIDGEIRQLVEVKLSVVPASPALSPSEPIELEAKEIKSLDAPSR